MTNIQSVTPKSSAKVPGEEPIGDILNRIATKKKDGTEKPKEAGQQLKKEDFLKFFMESLKNQDPTNPVKPEDFSAKLADFSSLEQLLNVNKNLEKMANQSGSNKVQDPMNFLGKEVTVDLSKIKVKNSTTAPIITHFDKSLEKVKVEIKDMAGNVIRHLNFDKKDIGEQKILWDGKDDGKIGVPDGQYTVSVSGSTPDGKTENIKLEKNYLIDAVDVNSNENYLFSRRSRYCAPQTPGRSRRLRHRSAGTRPVAQSCWASSS